MLFVVVALIAALLSSQTNLASAVSGGVRSALCSITGGGCERAVAQGPAGGGDGGDSDGSGSADAGSGDSDSGGDDGDDDGGPFDFVGDAWDGATGVAGDAWDGATDFAGGAWDGVATVASGGWDGLSAVTNGFVLGDYADPYGNPWLEGARIFGQFGSGVLIFGDVRDGAHAVDTIGETGGEDEWADLAWNGIGLVPVVGDFGKGARAARNAERAFDAAADARRSMDALDVARRLDVVDELAEGGSTLSSRSARLRQNMTNLAREHPEDFPRFADPGSTAAHHMVPWDDARAARARDILDEYGVDVDSASNGVFLPFTTRNADGDLVLSNPDLGDAANHRVIHTDAYMDEITQRLEGAQSREDVIDILNDAREELLIDEFPYGD